MTVQERVADQRTSILNIHDIGEDAHSCHAGCRSQHTMPMFTDSGCSPPRSAHAPRNPFVLISVIFLFLRFLPPIPPEVPLTPSSNVVDCR